MVSRIPDGRGGELVERHVLPVDVPIDLRDVAAAMVRGNVIAVQGVLDVLTTEIAGDEVIEQRLIEVREDWSARSAELEPDARTQVGREVARTLRTLGTERSLCLRATRVTLVSGDLGELRETQRARTAHIRTLRSGGRPQRPVAHAAAFAATSPMAALPDDEDGAASSATIPHRHRKRVRVEGEDTVLEMQFAVEPTVEHADAEEQDGQRVALVAHVVQGDVTTDAVPLSSLNGGVV